MQLRRLTPWLPAALAILAAATAAGAVSAETTVVLVRHAEKQDGDDPHLTAEGVARAKALVEVASGVTAVYATETCRTAQTVQWLAAELGLTIQVQDFGEPGLAMDRCELIAPVRALPPEVDGEKALAAHILAAERGGTVVVAGHSNTVPQIVEALGAGALCPETFPFLDNGECHIPDEGEASEYDNLFVVTVPDGVRLVKARYGD
jgi:phosphohistidine phosphatase SixA